MYSFQTELGSLSNHDSYAKENVSQTIRELNL